MNRMKKIVRAIVPPILWWGLNGISWKLSFLMSKRKPTLSGIYSKFDQIKKSDENSFIEKKGITFALEKIGIIQKKTNQGNYWSFSDPTTTEIDQPGDLALVTLINTLIGQGYFAHIIDYGGALGNIYYAQRQKIVEQNFCWHIVEQTKLVEIGKTRFSQQNLKFYSKISEINTDGKHPIVVAFFRSVVQYFDEATFEDILDKLEEKNTKYIVFTRLPVGLIPDFFTEQHLWGTSIPFRFYNIDTFKQIISKHGLKLIQRCAENEFLNMENFPKKYRLNNTICLIFKR